MEREDRLRQLLEIEDDTAALELFARARRSNDARLELEVLARAPVCGTFPQLASLLETQPDRLDEVSQLLDRHWPDAHREATLAHLATWLDTNASSAPPWATLLRRLHGELWAGRLDRLVERGVATHLKALEVRLPQRSVSDDLEVLRSLRAMLGEARLHTLHLVVGPAPALHQELAATLRALQSHPLVELHLEGTLPAVEAALVPLIGATCVASIERLELSIVGEQTDYESGSTFCDFLRQRELGNLRELSIAGDGARRVPSLFELSMGPIEHRSALERLSLRHCEVGDDGVGDLIESLGYAGTRDTLEVLAIEADTLTTRSVQCLLGGLPGLRRLSLRDNAVEEIDADAIWQAPPARLRELDLTGNALPDRVREHLDARQSPTTAGASVSEAPGAHVRHPKFGVGVISEVRGDIVHAGFGAHGDKKIHRRFLTFLSVERPSAPRPTIVT